MKKILSLLTACSLLGSSAALLPASGADFYLHTDFETDLDGWGARASEKVAITDSAIFAGTKSAAISNRTDSWNGIARSLDSSAIKPGKTYSIGAMVMQNSTPAAVHFKLTLQCSTGGGDNPFPLGGGSNQYISIAEGDIISGTWSSLANKSFTIPEGATNLVLYIETEKSTCDFFVDEIYIADEGITPSGGDDPQPVKLPGDVDSNNKVDAMDARLLQQYLLTETADINGENADLDGNGKVNAIDLSLLKNRLLNPAAYTTTTTTTTTIMTTTTTSEYHQSNIDPKELMANVQSALDQSRDVPDNIKNGQKGTVTHFTYSSKKAGHDKGANVWLPPGYSENQKYPVLYMGHGIFGNENSMLSGFSVPEMAYNLISSGKAQPFIIIFTQMYTDPKSEQPAGMAMTQETMDRYDDYLYDLTESLMPYVESHWSVKTGRENTAVAGFSMGGREALYCILMRPDVFGYCAASSPAPGIFPCVDTFLTHRGSYGANGQIMSKGDFKFPADSSPYLLMVGGGTGDNVVGTFPKQYHEAFASNNTAHVWLEVPNGGHDGSVGIPLFYHYFQNIFKN